MAMRKRYFFHFTWIFHTTLLFWEMPPPLSLSLSFTGFWHLQGRNFDCSNELDFVTTSHTFWMKALLLLILLHGSKINAGNLFWWNNQKTFLKFSPACECFNKTKQTKKIFLNILQIRSFNAFQSSLTHSLALALFLSKYIFSSSTSIFIWSP